LIDDLKPAVFLHIIQQVDNGWGDMVLSTIPYTADIHGNQILESVHPYTHIYTHIHTYTHIDTAELHTYMAA
jgi:hypothetical protein